MPVLGESPTSTTPAEPLVTLDLVIDQLHKNPNAADNDALQQHLDTAISLVVNMCRPLQPVTVTDWLNGGNGSVMLSEFPVTQIVSVTTYDSVGPLTYQRAGGSSGNPNGWTLDASAGALRRVGYGTWPLGVGNLEVVYTVGPDEVPPEVVRAVVVLVDHLWSFRKMQGTPSRPDLPSEDSMGYSPSYAIPNQVYELLREWLKPPRVA